MIVDSGRFPGFGALVSLDSPLSTIAVRGVGYLLCGTKKTIIQKNLNFDPVRPQYFQSDAKTFTELEERAT